MGSRVLYELDYRKPVLYVIPIQSILGKVAVVPVGDTGTIPFHLRNVFPRRTRRPQAGYRAALPATDAGCGLSTRGHWDGPVICNEWKGVEGTARLCDMKCDIVEKGSM